MITPVLGGRVRFIWRFCAAVLLAAPLAAQYTLGTAAGGAVPNGVSAASVLLRPLEAAVDSQGNYYTSDGAVVYRITAAGVISPIAGNGRLGYSGDGGPATSAQLNNANGIALDTAGNVYIADTNNHVIRKVTPGGTISTVAGNGTPGFSGDGGPAASAQLRFPQAVAVDAGGTNLYISDSVNNVIRRVTAGTITTFAGSGDSNYNGDNISATQASLYQPAGIVLDTSGALYIADRLHNMVRKVSGGLISTIAGSGLAGYTGDGNFATAARLNGPLGVSVDLGNNLYIADAGNSVVRQVTSSGTITTLAGSTPGYSGDGSAATAAQLRGPQRVLADNRGNIIIADTMNNRLRKVVQSTGVISTIAGGGPGGDGGAAVGAQLLNSGAVAVDRNGDLYVSDVFDHRVRKITRAGVISTVAGTGQAGYSGDNGPAASARLFAPGGIAFDAQNNLYIADTGNNVIRKVDATTAVISTVVGVGAGLQNPLGIAVDSSGALYIADTYNNVIRKAVSGVTTPFAGNGTLGYSGDGLLAIGAQLSLPTGVTVDASGNVYVADNGNAAVRKIDTSGIISTVAGSGPSGTGFSGDGGQGVSAQLSQPRAVAVDAAGNLFIADYGNNRVRKLSAGGVISTIAGGGSSSALGDGGPATSVVLGGLQGIAVDTSGTVYFSDASNARVRSLSLPTVAVTITTNPTGLQITADGATLTAPATLEWAAGSTHTIGTTSPQNGKTFQSWSDSGSQVHSITVPGSATTYTAVFNGGTTNCTYQVSPLSMTFSAAPSSGTVSVTTQPGCTYTAGSTSAFLLVTNGPNYTGSGTVTFSFGANIGVFRTGGLTVAGQTVTVTQLASPTNVAPLVNKPGIFRASGEGGVLWVRDRDGDGLFTVPPDTAVGNGVLGVAGDQPLIGDWTGSGTQKLGVFRPFGSTTPVPGVFVLDYDGNEQWNPPTDKALWFPVQAGDIAVVGHWTGGLQDRLGVYRQGVFYLDVNANGSFTKVIIMGAAGDIPMIGDWNGDGRSKVGVYRNGLWVLDYNGNGQWDGPTVDKAFYLGAAGDQPVVGDWNGDGKTKAGVFRKSAGLWVLDYNGNGQWDGTSTDRALFNGFDTSTSTGVVGDWTGDGKTKVGVFSSGTWFLDATGEGTFGRLAYLGQTGDTPVVGKW